MQYLNLVENETAETESVCVTELKLFFSHTQYTLRLISPKDIALS